QVLARTGEKQEAYEAFKKAGSSNSASYRTKFNARIKQSEVFDGTDIKKEVDALRRMTRYGRNQEYLDQIYYAIGNLYLSRRDTTEAIRNYELAVEKSTRAGIDKAMAQLTLGGLYFDRHQYEKAQPCYAEAVAQIPDDYPDYKLLKRRSDVLDELAIYSQNVTLQDSLLRLSEMPLPEQEKIIRKIIKELEEKEKKEAEDARREEYLANQAAAGTGLQDNNANTPNSFVLNSDNSWYFYNAATSNAGKTAFQRRWGSRKLEDNWRRRNKSSFDMSDFDSDNSDENTEEDTTMPNDTLTPEERKRQTELEANENDPHKVEYYLKQIPKTDMEKATANEVIQEGLYNMGVILKDKLEDYPAATSEFNRLLTRYPDNIYRLDVYYNLYLMYIRSGDTAMAERYRNLIVNDFPESLYGQAMRDPNYIDNLRTMEKRQ
ncbi:MAG: tetratricopeptide repeat protein, partial [Muribaculaceae bacterium]|nr:tetratricopeptide repeat protein [Muribaculaceae bacterium]